MKGDYPPSLQGEHPDHPGWREWRAPGPARFNRAVLGTLLVRMDDAEHARIRMFPQEMHLNVNDVIHGGVILSLIDVAMFAGSSMILGKSLERGVTVELQNHFLAAGDSRRPLDAVLEVVRETGRMVFMRGMVMQEDDLVSSFTGIIRKITVRK